MFRGLTVAAVRLRAASAFAAAGPLVAAAIEIADVKLPGPSRGRWSRAQAGELWRARHAVDRPLCRGTLPPARSSDGAGCPQSGSAQAGADPDYRNRIPAGEHSRRMARAAAGASRGRADDPHRRQKALVRFADAAAVKGDGRERCSRGGDRHDEQGPQAGLACELGPGGGVVRAHVRVPERLPRPEHLADIAFVGRQYHSPGLLLEFPDDGNVHAPGMQQAPQPRRFVEPPEVAALPALGLADSPDYRLDGRGKTFRARDAAGDRMLKQEVLLAQYRLGDILGHAAITEECAAVVKHGFAAQPAVAGLAPGPERQRSLTFNEIGRGL